MTRRRRHLAATLALVSAHAGSSVCCGPAPATVAHHGPLPVSPPSGAVAKPEVPTIVVTLVPTTTEPPTVAPTTTEPPDTPSTARPVPAGATTATTAPAPAGSIDDFPTPSPQGRTTRQPGEPLDGLADCESGNTNADTGNGYYGFVQFSAATWHGMGESGLPTDYDRSYQLDVARRLQQRSGWGQWPACARQLGLL